MPIGEYRGRLRRKSCERFQNLFRRRLQRIDPQIGRRPPRHRLTFGNGAVAELARERRPEPLRNIGASGVRSIVERSRQPGALDVRERRRRMVGSVTGFNDLFRRETEGGGCGTDRKRHAAYRSPAPRPARRAAGARRRRARQWRCDRRNPQSDELCPSRSAQWRRADSGGELSPEPRSPPRSEHQASCYDHLKRRSRSWRRRSPT